MAASPDLPRESVAAQPWIVSLHLATVAARLAVMDPEAHVLEDEDGPGLQLGQGMEFLSVCLLNPVARDILEGLQFTRGDGADMWTAVHRELPDAWHKTFRPPSHERLVGVEWRVRAANSPCPLVVVLPKTTGPSPSWETVAVLWGWVTVRGSFGGHVLTARRGKVVETDGAVALQLMAEPLTTHVVVAILRWGAERPQPWRYPINRVIWVDLLTMRATIWLGGAGRHLPGALPCLRDCGDASPPPAAMRNAPEGLYATGDKPRPRHHFLVAADHTAELGDDMVALVADLAQCPAPHATMLPGEGWEGQQHTHTPDALLIARYVELGGSEAVYLDRLGTLDRPPHLGPQRAVAGGPAGPAYLGGKPAPVAAHLGHCGQNGAHGAKGAEGGVAGCRELASDGPGGTRQAAGLHLQGMWTVRPHFYHRYRPPGAEAGQPPVHVGEAVGGGGGP